jgi:cell division septum initiation protein DivIVA
MVRYKNAGGAPSDRDDSRPRRTEVARGKRVKIAAKKRKRNLIEAEIAQAVADAADATERGGRSSGIRIGESRFHLEGRQLGTESIEEIVEAPEETVDALQSSLQRIHRRLRSRQHRLHSVVA